MAGNRGVAAEPNFVARPGGMHGGDHLQNVFIQSVVVDNVRALRSPYLDLREGIPGRPLKTTSLDVPWTALLAVAWPLVGLVPTTWPSPSPRWPPGWPRSPGCAATRWQLLAAAGALAYAFTPHRMFQLTSHFNAVMWWAFPAALLAFEVMVGRRRAEEAVGVAGGRAGRGHPDRGRQRRVPPHPVPDRAARVPGRLDAGGRPGRPARRALGAAGRGRGHARGGLRLCPAGLPGRVQGVGGGRERGWQQVVLYSPASVWAMVRKTFGTQGEGLIYVGWPLLVLAGIGLVAVVAGGGRRLAYAVLAVPLVLLTYGARANVAGFGCTGSSSTTCRSSPCSGSRSG